jgi:murein L,D-transpeptidase YcbB/YkuD
MQKVRFDHLLAGTAIALALTLGSYAANAQAQSDAAISAAVPMPEAADVPPPTIADIKPAAEVTPPEAVEAKPADARAPSAEITHSVPESTGAKTVTAAAADTALVDRLRDQLAAGKFDRVLGGKKERSAIEAFYSSRNFAPLWIADGAIGERGKAAIAYLAGVEADGLDPADYPVPQSAGADADAQAEAEIKLTDAVLTYARHATSGRVHYSRVAGDIIYDLAKVEPADALAKLANAKDMAEALDSFEPQNPYYRALKAKLAEARRSGSETGKPAIPAGPTLKIVKQTVKDGKEKKTTEVLMDDPRVPALRERLGLGGQGTTYDKALTDAVSKFQKEHGLAVNGQLNSATLEAINGPKREKAADLIVANLERWRWIPRDLGKTYVMVNIPDYTLRVVRDGKLVWKTKIVVGKPTLPTPLLTAEMKFITVNPTWNVPPSIIQNEYLPALQQDPQAMERIGLKVEQDRDGNIRIYQPPGDKNALGRIRFNFPNKFLVYQHDTPDKHLFAHDKRAYSHGCMRVENPLKYGEVILGLVLPNEHYTADRLQKMFGGSEININFPTNIPVHLTYQTAFVDDAGNLEIRDDVYGRDQRLLAILKGSDRKVADIAVDRPKGSSSAPVRMPPGTFGGGGGSGGGFFSGPSFFDRLFGGREPAPRPPARLGRANDRNTFR